MALEGALRDLGLAEVIQLLSGGRRTGAHDCGLHHRIFNQPD